MLRLLALIGGTAALVLSASGASAGPDPNLMRAQAFVHHHCRYRPDASMWMRGATFNALVGNCNAGDGRDQRVWFFVKGGFVGNDARTSSKEIIGLWRDDVRIAFLYVLYRHSDANCCPTGGGQIVRFRWTGQRVRRLDKLPHRQLGAVAAGR